MVQGGPGIGFHIGNGIVGLSFGVALGGGGAGTTRIWTQNDLPIFLGNESNGMLMGIGTNGGSNVTLLNLTHAGPENKVLEIEPDGDVVAANKPRHETLFDEFGGDGSGGDLSIADSGEVVLGVVGEHSLRMQYSNLTLGEDATLTLRARYNYIAVSGVCQLDFNAHIRADGTGGIGGFGGNVGPGTPGESGRTYTDLCVSGAGEPGDSTAQFAGGLGGSAEGDGGSPNSIDTQKRIVILGGSDSYFPHDRLPSGFRDLLFCPGGGGGGGAGTANASAVGGKGGAGGGVIYIECNQITAQEAVRISAGGLRPEPPVNFGGSGGAGGGGVVIVRVRNLLSEFRPTLQPNAPGDAAKGYAAFEVLEP